MEDFQQPSCHLFFLPTELFLQICTTCIHYYHSDSHYDSYYREKCYKVMRCFGDENEGAIELPILYHHQSLLTIRDWSNLDQAITNRNLRNQYLSILSSQQLFSPIQYLSTSSMKWIELRQLKLLSFTISPYSIEEMKYVHLDLSLLKVLIIPTHSKESFFDMLAIINKCKDSLHLINFTKNQNVNITVLKNICKKSTNLKFLSLNSCKYIHNSVMEKLAKFGQSLLELNLSHCQLSDEGLRNVIQSKRQLSSSFKYLKSVDLSYNRFSYQMLERFFQVVLTKDNLKEISVNYLDFPYHTVEQQRSEVFSFFNFLATMNSSLFLFGNRGNSFLTDEHVLLLVSKHSAIKQLNFTECSRLTDQSLFHLAAHCLRLRALDIRDCFSLTDCGIREIFQSCVDLRDLAIDGCYQMTKVTLEERRIFQAKQRREILMTFTQCAKMT